MPPLGNMDEILPLLAAAPRRRLAEVDVKGRRGLSDKPELLLVPPLVVAVLDLDGNRLGDTMLLIDVVGNNYPAIALKGPPIVVDLELHH
jgi:hypothetical protein